MTARSIVNPERTFIRFTGGEPLMHWEPLGEALRMLADTHLTKSVPILIQTNGSLLLNSQLPSLFPSTGLFLLEYSFKGTNSREFHLLTGMPSELYESQLAGYESLELYSRTHHNVALVPVLGIYHSSATGKSKWILVDPDTKKPLFEDRLSWDSRFAAIWESALVKWVERLRLQPKGLLERVVDQCKKPGILVHHRNGLPTNTHRYFRGKPLPRKYALGIIDREYWH